MLVFHMLSTKDSRVSSVSTASAADSDHVKRVTGVKFGLTGKEPLKWVVYRANVRGIIMVAFYSSLYTYRLSVRLSWLAVVSPSSR
jgi:hypothetical protein